MSEPCFDTLRTKEQLGYDVFSMIRNTYGVIGLSITVNSQVAFRRLILYIIRSFI